MKKCIEKAMDNLNEFGLKVKKEKKHDKWRHHSHTNWCFLFY